jgi:hypothetical protein
MFRELLEIPSTTRHRYLHNFLYYKYNELQINLTHSTIGELGREESNQLFICLVTASFLKGEGAGTCEHTNALMEKGFF